jgi:hypothetical protein
MTSGAWMTSRRKGIGQHLPGRGDQTQTGSLHFRALAWMTGTL